MNDVLVDTSAWIEFFRDQKSKCGEVVDVLLGEGRVCTTPLIVVEVVSGARNRNEFERLRRDFAALPCVNQPDMMWEMMLEKRWLLKSKGFGHASIPDLVIVLVALAHEKIILSTDQDFLRMKLILDLNLLEI